MVQLLINSKGLQMNPLQSLYYISPACLMCLSLPLGAAPPRNLTSRSSHAASMLAMLQVQSRVYVKLSIWRWPSCFPNPLGLISFGGASISQCCGTDRGMPCKLQRLHAEAPNLGKGNIKKLATGLAGPLRLCKDNV